MKTLYKTITATHRCDLDEEVNKYLEQGWELYGNPYTTGWRKVFYDTDDTSYDREIEFCQAIIKKIEE